MRINVKSISGVVLGIALAGSIAFTGGCASGKSQDTGSAAAVVEMHFHSFEPAQVTIRAGEEVLWRNTSIIWHTVTADPSLAKKPEDVALPPGAKPFDSGKVPAGNSYRQTFTTPGTYRYFCKPHETKGMVGEIVVQPK